MEWTIQILEQKLMGTFEWLKIFNSHVCERNITGFKVFLVRTYWEFVICLLINLPLWIAYGTIIWNKYLFKMPGRIPSSGKKVNN